MTLFEQFCETICKLTDTIHGIADIEKNRLQAASAKEHHLIHTFLNEEQAALLNLKGLDQRRAKQAADLGWKDLTVSQILDTADVSQKAVLTPLFENLNKEVSLLKEVRESADRIVNVRIHEIEELIALSGGTAKQASSNLFQDKYV